MDASTLRQLGPSKWPASSIAAASSRRRARVCQQVIAARPANADAHNILGVTLSAMGRHDEAVESLKRAVKINANAASYHANLGEVLRVAGRTDEAKNGA